MTLARRNVLLGGASAAVGALALPRQYAAPALSTAAASLNQTGSARQPRKVVLLHSGDAPAWSFANAARGATAAAALQKPTLIVLSTDPGANHASITAALAAARGKRLLALLNAQDDLILNAALRTLGGVYYLQGLHSSGRGFSRHLIRASASLPNVTTALATPRHCGADDFAAATGLSIPASWPAVLGSLLGKLASGSYAAAQDMVVQRAHFTDLGMGRINARASLLIDL